MVPGLDLVRLAVPGSPPRPAQGQLVSVIPGGVHIGRGWSGTRTEDECPCEQEACGLVSSRTISEACPQHAATKTIRQGHAAEDCPGVRE